jgi:hypothetical protein
MVNKNFENLFLDFKKLIHCPMSWEKRDNRPSISKPLWKLDSTNIYFKNYPTKLIIYIELNQQSNGPKQVFEVDFNS